MLGGFVPLRTPDFSSIDSADVGEKRTNSVLVVIPSRLARMRTGELYLSRALASVRQQTVFHQLHVDVVVGLDAGAAPPALGAFDNISFAHGGHSQAAALNAAARLDHDAIAFLEDDDTWHSQFLEIAIDRLRRFDFVSSTQLEVDEVTQKGWVNDFPTPSGWVMRADAWREVGPFNEGYRWHLDNEWLGRLSETSNSRVHLVEWGRPLHRRFYRWLRQKGISAVSKNGGPNVTIAAHHLRTPLVTRARHDTSGMGRIRSDPTLSTQSRAEFDALIRRFGRIPY